MDSIWQKDGLFPPFNRLEGNQKTDVLIIGAGITGILCAYFLEQEGIDYMLVEQGKILNGVTKYTTAKITSQHGLIYHKLVQEFGSEYAKMYYQANEDALKEYQMLTKKFSCEFQIRDSYVYSVNKKNRLEKEMNTLERLEIAARYANQLEIPIQGAEAISFPKQAQFQPLQFLAKLAANLNIYENTKVVELAPNLALTNRGSIMAENIIVTTHYPFNNKHGAYFLKMYQSRSYVIALQKAQKLAGMYVDESDKGLSFRDFGEVLLLGGGSHRTGKSGGKWEELSVFANEHYKEAVEVGRWSTQDCMTLDKVPYIGQYGRHTKGFYVASGYNKWGMTSSMVAAKLLKDCILERDNPYQAIFAPGRTILRQQLFVNLCESTCNLLTPTKKRCPHMGCALKWNKEEHSWDCPCHGSRFSENGEVINNPATDDLKK